MRARLTIPILVAFLALALAAHALALASTPQLLAPNDGATFTAGDKIVFQANEDATAPGDPQAADHMDFYVARDPAVGPNGVFANFIDHFQGPITGNDGGTPGNNIYSGSAGSDSVWPDRPGIYFWQAVYYDCAPNPADCFNESATRTFTINPKPASAVNSPDDLNTFLDKHPKHRTHHRKVKFTFSANVKGAKFQCLYANGWAKCDSPHVFRDLSPGHYQFKVRAVSNHVKDSSPATWTFRILR